MRITPLEIKSETVAAKLMTSLGVSSQGIRILSPKSVYSAFKIEGIKSWEANIIKQHLLSSGTDAAIERTALVKDIRTGAFVFGSLAQLRNLCSRLKEQPFNLSKISQDLSFYLDNLQKKEFIFKARDKVLRIKTPICCGIINVTEDSFSGDGLLAKANLTGQKIKYLALKQAESMLRAGAKMLDIGAESSRPFSKPIKDNEEKNRIKLVLPAIRKEFGKALLSVDTHKYSVAKVAADRGVDIINDITALSKDPKMVTLVEKYKLGCILMHMKGTPRNMQIKPKYKDVVADEIDFFKKRLDFCIAKGVNQSRILIDPGIGFGKRTQDNVKLINELYKFKVFGVPIFLGLSRKSFISKILNKKKQDCLTGTISAGVISLIKGANILRVHDVRETVQAIKIATKIINN